MNKTVQIIKLLRPSQWVKNSFVFLPIFLNGQLKDFTVLWYAVTAFILFCLTSSAIYCINDSVDVSYDAVNPDKKNRPVASGAISIIEAVSISMVLLLAAVGFAFLSGNPHILKVLEVLALYFFLNLSYTLWLKKLPLLDVVVVSVCFLLRVFAGGVACGIPLTTWTLVLVFFLTLMLAMGKRRHEAWLYEKYGIVSRGVIRHYNLKFLSILLVVLGISSFGLYLGWSFSDYAVQKFGNYLYPTSFFVAQGIGRYLWIILKDNGGGNPTRLILHDRIIQLAVICWSLCFGYIIYC